MPPRKSIKRYALHKRYLGMTCAELRKAGDWRKKLRTLTILHAVMDNQREKDDVMEIIHIVWMSINWLHTERVVPRPLLIPLHRTFDSFSDSDIPNLFRFRNRIQLRQLYIGLKIQDKIILPSRNICTGEELLLVGLIRISSVSRLQDLEVVFGKPYSWISQVFSYFVIWVEKKHGWRLYDNLDYWVSDFNRFAEAIRMKVERLSDGALSYDVGSFRVCCFTDCVNQVISRPGTGPLFDGPDAPRADPSGWVQRVFYNRWLADCGMKYGTLDAPCGMTVYASQGESSRHSDLRWLSESGINTKFETVQVSNGGDPEDLYKMYGDSIFPWLSCLRSRYRGNNLNAREQTENKTMTSCRQSIEWHYGEVKRLKCFFHS
jgi:DDE superfamily endonuclease